MFINIYNIALKQTFKAHTFYTYIDFKAHTFYMQFSYFSYMRIHYISHTLYFTRNFHTLVTGEDITCYIHYL